jgi:LAS superfamily LD-carboxypeptidase LdcB
MYQPFTPAQPPTDFDASASSGSELAAQAVTQARMVPSSYETAFEAEKSPMFSTGIAAQAGASALQVRPQGTTLGSALTQSPAVQAWNGGTSGFDDKPSPMFQPFTARSLPTTSDVPASSRSDLAAWALSQNRMVPPSPTDVDSGQLARSPMFSLGSAATSSERANVPPGLSGYDGTPVAQVDTRARGVNTDPSSKPGICELDAKGKPALDSKKAPKLNLDNLTPETTNGYTAQPDGGSTVVPLDKNLTVNGQPMKVSPEAQAGFDAMATAAKKDGVDLRVSSGYRGPSTQAGTFCSEGNGAGEADGKRPKQNPYSAGGDAIRAKAVAPPGFSEHQTGNAMDISFDPKTQATKADWNSEQGKKAYDWLNRNAARFGFEQSYNGTGATQEEKWHWRQTGKKAE